MFKFSLGPWGSKFSFLLIWSTSDKIKFSSMKMKDHGICTFWNFSIKNGCQKFIFGFLGSQCPAVSAVWYLFLKKHAIFWTILLDFSVFLVKQNASLIYFKEKSFCLSISLGLQGPLSCSNTRKIFYAYEVKKYIFLLYVTRHDSQNTSFIQ